MLLGAEWTVFIIHISAWSSTTAYYEHITLSLFRYLTAALRTYCDFFDPFVTSWIPPLKYKLYKQKNWRLSCSTHIRKYFIQWTMTQRNCRSIIRVRCLHSQFNTHYHCVDLNRTYKNIYCRPGQATKLLLVKVDLSFFPFWGTTVHWQFFDSPKKQ